MNQTVNTTGGGDSTRRAAIAWPRLRECIADGRSDEVIKLLAPYGPDDLGHVRAELKTLFSELRRLERTSYREAYKQYAPLLAAALASARTEAQAEFWLTKSTLLILVMSREANRRYADTRPGTMLGLLIERHDAQWIGELACRLADALRPDPDLTLWSIVHALATHSKAAVPFTDGYIVGWMSRMADLRYPASRRHDGSLLPYLRAEPRLRECIARVFEVDGVGSEFLARGDGRWSRWLAVLAEEGLLDRGELLDQCTARLMRTGRPSDDLRGHITIHDGLAPTPAEVGQRLATYLGMAASAPALTAKIALRELRALDAHSPLEPHTLAELCTDVLARTETGLVSEQLSWIDATLKRDPAATGLLLRTLAVAFSHPAVSVQRRALKLVAKHAKRADTETLADVRAGARNLDATLRADARLVLIDADTADEIPDDEPLPAQLPPYLPTPMPTAFETPDDLVTAFAAPLADIKVDQMEAERIMAGVAALSVQSRPALAAALTPLGERYPCQYVREWQFSGALRCLFETVLGIDHDHTNPSGIPGTPTTVLRINELADALRSGRAVPVLLATPTAADGSIDPAVLLARLKAYEDAGAEPLRHDLVQAMFRVPQHTDPQLGAALAKRPPLPRPVPDFDEHYHQEIPPSADPVHLVRPLSLPRDDTSREPLPTSSRDQESSLFRHLVPPYGPRAGRRSAYEYPVGAIEDDCWPMLLPHHPDLVAAHAIPHLHMQANHADSSGSAFFPQLAETAGRPGPVTHLALAYGLAADRLDNRVAALDALLILAARGLLRPELLGRMAAALWKRSLIRSNRLLASLDAAEQAGAIAEVFGVAAAVIEDFAATPAQRGLPDLLLLATRCATTKPVPGARIAGLADLAALAKPVRVGQEARRLVSVLASSVEPR
jgi:hypothetical protein